MTPTLPRRLVGLPTAEPITSSPPPSDDDADDDVFLLGERCADAYMQADALQYRAMTLLAEFHRRRGWIDTGFSSTAEWLAWRIGVHGGAARERVRAALALQNLPETSRAMENGELSFTKVRALTRVATPDNEGELLHLARAGSAANLERMVRGWRSLDGTSEVEAEERRYRSRRLRCFVDLDGMVVVQGRLDPEAGALLMRALDAAGDALFKADTHEEPERRRADALGLMAERALGAGFGGAEAPVSGSRADRTQVVLHVEASTLSGEGEPGTSELEDGTRVSAETSRRMACDAGRVRMVHDSTGRTLSVSRRTRTVPPAIRRALEARDRGCRFPGCGLRFTEAHHVHHWAQGGDTSLANLVLLCRRHHRAVHEGGVRVCIDRQQQVVFFTRKGAPMSAAPRFRGNVHLPPEPREIRPRRAGWDGSSRWKRDRLVPWATEARALAALEATE
ncbi:MAG: HNH endonuclease [Gemmatimonadota bacterium]|nr:HNH endonuclease [Gemmatimonadota bacterium]